MRRVLPAVLLVSALLGVGLLLDVLTARPASAHAAVVTTTPADGDRLDVAPTQVTIEFDEHVSLGAGYARVLDGDGDRVDTGEARVRDSVVTVDLPDQLPDAGYVVTYRVVSADSHPVSGAFSFVVGDGELVPAGSVGTGDATDPGVAVLLSLARWIGYAGLALGLGVPLALATCWPGGWAAARLRRVTLAGLADVVLGGVLLLLAQGPYAAASGLGSLFDGRLLGSTLGSVYGCTVLARILLAVLLAVAVARRWRPGGPPGRAALAGWALLAAALAVSMAAVGHPVAGSLPVFAVAVSTVHVVAMSGWLGGLFVLVAGALRAGTPLAELDAALPRWSRLAGGYIGALVVTGVLQSVREVGSFSALVSTSYGWVLLAKVAVVLLVLSAAAVSRDWVQQRVGGGRRPGARRPRHQVVAHAFSAAEPSTADPQPAAGEPAADDQPTADEEPAAVADPTEPPARLGVLRRSVLVELVGAVVVLALSAVLVSQYPAKASVAEPVQVTLPLQSASGTEGNGTVQISLDPAQQGPTTLHVYLYDDAGRLIQPQQISVTLTEVQQEIGPLDVDLAAAGPGHYVADPDLPASGTWTLTVTVRLDEFTAVTASTVFPVR